MAQGDRSKDGADGESMDFVAPDSPPTTGRAGSGRPSGWIERIVRVLALCCRTFHVRAALLLMGALLAGAAHAQSVSAGALLFVAKNCAGCHQGSPAAASANHRLASNNPQRIIDAINGVYPAVGGQMKSKKLALPPPYF